MKSLRPTPRQKPMTVLAHLTSFDYPTVTLAFAAGVGVGVAVALLAVRSWNRR